MPAAKATKAAEVTEEEVVDNSGPMIVKSSGKAQERVVLFTIDDEEFTVPKKPGVNITLKFINEMRKSNNEMFAALGLLEAMLGTAKYNQLLDYDELEDDLLSKILEQVVKLAMDRVEETSGKS